MKTRKVSLWWCVWGGGHNSLLYKALIVSVILISLFSVSCKEPVFYSVLFESNGGTAVQAQSIQEGKTVNKPTNPTKDGCVFTGWFSDIGLTIEYDFSTPVKNDFVLYAKWFTPRQLILLISRVLAEVMLRTKKLKTVSVLLNLQIPQDAVTLSLVGTLNFLIRTSMTSQLL